MEKPTKAKILWLLKKNGNKNIIVGFLRDQRDGCFIIGGPTGSHYTAHTESWELKWKEFMQNGYIDINSAIKNKLLSSDWQPPKIREKDKTIIKMILQERLEKKQSKRFT